MIKIHEINGYIETLYLVEYPDKLLLLDGGCRCDVMVVKNHIETVLKRDFGDLKLVVITHAHPDHSGGASAFKDHGVKIAGYKDHNKWYAGFTGKITFFADIILTYLVATKKKRKKENIWFRPKIDFDFILKDKDTLPGFPDWKAIHCPGHTYYDLSLVKKDHKLAYIADNIICNNIKKYRPYPLASPEDYKKTLLKYKEMGIKYFLLAHHGKHEVTEDEINLLIQSSPSKPRIHRSNFLMILKHLFTVVKR